MIAFLAMALFAPLLLTVAAVAPAAAQPNGATCYAVSDGGGNNQGGVDQLISITNGVVTEVGDSAMVTNDAEAFAIRPGFGGYAWSGNDGLGLREVDLTTGVSVDAAFDVPGPKVEGLTWANIDDADPDNDILYVVRLNGVVQGYTPAGADAGLDATITDAVYTEGTDIAWDPTADQLYAIRTNTSGGANPDQTEIVTVSPAVAALGGGDGSALDLEGLGFTDDGTMIGTTGDDGDPIDRLYVVSKADGSVGASLATLAPTDNEDVDCLNPVLDTNLTATSSVACVNEDGQISIAVVNSTAAPRDYTVTVNNTVRMATVAANSTMTETIVGLIDTTFTVTATDNTADPDVQILNTTETVDCDGVLTLTATSSVACVNQDGEIAITVANPSAGPRDYTITVNNTSRMGTVAAGASTTETIVGLIDATFTVTATDNTADPDVQILNTTEIVDCDGVQLITATSTVDCIGLNGAIAITVTNPSGAPRDYEVAVNNTVRDGTLAAGASITETISGLADLTFAVTATDTTANPAQQVLTTTQVVDCDEAPTATIAQACVNFDGEISFTVTNNSGVVIDYEVAVNNTVRQGTLAGGASTVETIMGLADGTFTATATHTNPDPDAVLATEQVIIDCDNPLPTSITTTCVAFDGVITSVVTNSTGAPIDYKVSVNNTMRVGTLADGETATEAISGLVDGDFAVTIEKTAPAPAAVLETSTETVACDNALTASVTNTCVGGDGEITILVTNSGNATTSYKVSVNNTMRAGTLFPGQTATETIVGLVDGTYTVSATNTSNDPDVDVLNESVVILCTSPLQAAVVDACVGIDGEITVTVTNPTNSTLTYEVSANATMRLGTLAPGATADEVFAGLADAAYMITVSDTTPADPVAVLVEEVTIDCADTALVATVTTTCVGEDGAITVTIENVDAIAHVYRVSVNNTSRIRTIAAGATATETISGLVDTTFAVSTTDLTPNPDVVVDMQMVQIACDSPLTATVVDACVGLDGEIAVTITNPDGVPRSYDLLLNNTLRQGTIAPGQATTQTFVGLADATYTATVTDTTGASPIEFFTQGITIDCADVAITATATPACPSVDGTITITMQNIDTVDRVYKVSVNNTMRVSTIAANSTKSETISGLIDTTFTVTVDDLTADPDMRVLEEQVTIDCDSGLAGSAAVTCVGLDGVITITIENPGDSTLTYKASVNNTNRFGLLGAGLTTTQAVSGLVDGDFTVVLMDTTPNPDVVVFSETVTVDCPDNPFNATVASACVGLDGEVTFTIENLDTVAVDYQVLVNATSRVGTIAVGDTATEAIGALGDGTYTVQAINTSTGVTVLDDTVTIDCADEPLSAVSTVTCVGVNGAIAVTVTNNDTVNRTYRVSVNNTSRIATLVPGASRTETISGLIDTTFAVSATDLTANPDMVVLDEQLTVACDGNLSFSPTVACTDNDGEITVSIGNTGAASTTYKVSINNTMRFGTIAAGQTIDQTIKGLIDGTFTVMGFNTGIDPDLLVLDTTVDVVCDEPLSALVSVLCDAPISADILIDTTNGGASAVTYRVTIAEAATPEAPFSDDTFTVAAGMTDASGFPLVPDGDYVVTVENVDAGTTVLSETITVTCDPVVTLVEICEGGNGTISVTVVNPNATQDLVGTLSVTGLGDKVVTISAGTTAMIARTGRPDGTYSVQFVLEGGFNSPDTVIDQNVLVQCDEDPGGLDPNVTYAITSFCGPDGRIQATINNASGVDVTYTFDVLEIQNHIPSTGTVGPGGSTALLRTGRPDGPYTVTLDLNGVLITETVVVNCQPAL